jgi:DNA repair protein RecO (recombination protein O)
LRRFEKSLLSTTGYSLAFDLDSNITNTIQSNTYYQFVPKLGFKPAKTGLLGQHILAFANDELDDPDVLKTAKFIMRQAIADLLEGRPLKSRQLWHGQSPNIKVPHEG